MFEKTDQSFGVNEVLLASVLGAVVFSLFAAQPLVIVGVTGESGNRPLSLNNWVVSLMHFPFKVRSPCSTTQSMI